MSIGHGLRALPTLRSRVRLDSGKDKGNDVIIPAQIVSRQARLLLKVY